MKKLDMSRTQRKALLYIAENGAATGYNLLNQGPLNSCTAYKAPKSLVKKGMLRLEEKGKTRAGLRKKEYHLTLLGLCTALRLGGFWDKVDEVVERWKYLDLIVLGKWKHLAKTVPREDLLLSLQEATKFICEFPLFDESGKRTADGPIIQVYFRTRFFSWIFDPLLRSDSQGKWIDAVRSDAELKDWVTGRLKIQISKFHSLTRWMEKMLHEIEEKG